MTQIVPHNPLEGNQPEFTINLHDGSEEQISIVIVHKDRPAYLGICLQSIDVTSFNYNYEIIVVDNGSGPESQEFLNDIQNDVKVIRNEKNLYWSEAANKGAAAVDKNSKYIIFMHCDVVILNPTWMDLLINVCESQSSGFVGVELQSYMMQNQKVDFVQEWLCMFTRECWKDIGPWPEKLPQVGQSFIMTIKGQQKGYKPQIMKNQIAHHYRIFSLDVNEYEKLVEQSMAQMPKLISDINSRAV